VKKKDVEADATQHVKEEAQCVQAHHSFVETLLHVAVNQMTTDTKCSNRQDDERNGLQHANY
jgi:hypothetical protein